MVLAELIADFATRFIEAAGYFSVFLLMVMESMFLPVPSEAVMPFAGFLVAEGKFSWLGVIFFSTLGSIIGSLISYYIGLWGGKPFLNKYGKYFLIKEKELLFTENFFKKYGSITIFISRFIPVVRHLISIPAGIAKMNLFKFSFYTIIGAGIWNYILTLAGYYLKQNWESIMEYSQIIDVVIIVLLLIGIILFVYGHLKKK